KTRVWAPTPHNIKQLERLNEVIFSASYNDKIYKDFMEVGELSKFNYHKRIEPENDHMLQKNLKSLLSNADVDVQKADN
uniref:Uncharacterized protein n=1 Tax=Oryctolagus cuniculus TaxID=9986 RepID=A0A5F9CFE7_RABIT